jgi:hypothetical protein
MKFNDFIVSEEKVRLDPKCWTGKKIGNPKTKVKGGVRVNNCVPAESVEEAANPAQQAAIAVAKKKKAGVDEAAPPGAKAERMVKHIKKGYAKDGKLSDKEKSIAYATAWKAHNKGVTEGTQRVDSLVTDALKIMQGSEASDAVAALKTVLGDREYNSRRGYYNFYVRQLMDMSGQQGMAEGVEADVKVYQNKMTGKFIAWVDHRGNREQAEGNTKQEAVTALMQKIDTDDSTRMNRAASTANQMKRFVLSGPFVRGTLGKQSKDPFFIKLDNQTLYVSDSPAAGFIRVKHDPSSQWNFM